MTYRNRSISKYANGATLEEIGDAVEGVIESGLTPSEITKALNNTVYSLNDLRQYIPYEGQFVYLSNGNISDLFEWTSADLSTEAAEDLLYNGEYYFFVPPSNEVGLSGAWVRVRNGYVNADMDGVSFNYLVKYSADHGLKLIGGDISISEIVTLHSNLRMELHSLSVSDSNGVFQAGTLNRAAISSASYHSCENNNKEDKVTLSSSEDVANFSVGDSVFIRAGDYYTTGGDDVYDYGHLDIITSIDGSDLYIRGAIDDNITNVSVSNVTDYVLQDMDIKIGKVSSTSTTIAKLFIEGGGFVDCDFEIDYMDVDSAVFTNAATRTHFKSKVVCVERHFFELGANSRRNIVEIGTAVMSGVGTSGKRPIRLSENAQFNKVKVNFLNLSNYTVDDIPIYIEGQNNEITLNKVDAENSINDLIQFTSQAFTPTPPDIYGNRIYIGSANVGSGTRYLDFNNSGGTLSDNLLIGLHGKGEFFGSVSDRAVNIDGDGNGVVSCYFESGQLFSQATATNEVVDYCMFPDGANSQALVNAITYKGTKLLDWSGAKAVTGHLTNVSVTSTDTDNTEFNVDIPANALQVGDVLSFTIYGSVSGTNNSKSIRLVVGGDIIAACDYASAETGDFSIVGTVQFNSITAMYSLFNVLSMGADPDSVQVEANGISDISSNTLSVSLSAYLGDESDSLTIYGFKFDIKKLGDN